MRTCSDSGSRIRRAMRLIGGNAAAAAVLLIPVEFGLRFFELEPALALPRIEFNWMDLTAWELPLDPDLLWVHPGYPDRVATARDQHPSIVFMGDSCTHWGRYDEKLESMFEARNPGSDLTFVNVGVVGWSSWSGLQQLQRDVLPMRPKAITLYYGWNDHWKGHLGIEDKNAARFFEEPSALRTVRLADKALFHFTRFFADPDRPRVSLDDFRANLRRMVRVAREHGIVPILLTAPTPHLVGGERETRTRWWTGLVDDLAPLHRRYVEAVREVAAAEGALLVDLYQEFGRLPRNDLKRFFAGDGVHLGPEGDQKIAELIDRRFVEADLYRRIVDGGGARGRAERAEAEARFEEAIDGARLLIRGPFDVLLDDRRLIWVKDRCDGSQDRVFAHVWPVDPDDLPDDRREHGFDNLDFLFWERRLGFTQRCAAARPWPDYPVAAIRTGQYQYLGENGSNVLWSEEFHFTSADGRH